MAIDNGTGAIVTFGTSSITANITAINLSGVTRESIPTSHLATTGGMTFIPADLYDPGEVTLEIQFDPDKDVEVDILRAEETVTVTWALATGQSTKSNWAASGFITSYGDVVTDLEALMTATIVVKWSGAIVTTPST